MFSMFSMFFIIVDFKIFFFFPYHLSSVSVNKTYLQALNFVSFVKFSSRNWTLPLLFQIIIKICHFSLRDQKTFSCLPLYLDSTRQIYPFFSFSYLMTRHETWRVYSACLYDQLNPYYSC